MFQRVRRMSQDLLHPKAREREEEAVFAAPEGVTRPQVYMDVVIGHMQAGRITMGECGRRVPGRRSPRKCAAQRERRRPRRRI